MAAFLSNGQEVRPARLLGEAKMPIQKASDHVDWQWTRIATEHDLFVGGQAEWTLDESLVLMSELFARDRGRMGAQAGVRWTTAGGHVDIDMLAGRYLEGETPHAVTLGITLR